LKKTYVEADLLNMAQGQYVNQKASLKTQDTHVFWDTDLHVINIWSKYKFGHSHRWIRKHAAAQRVDLYLLTHYDIPYEQDPLRENPHNRKELFEIYLDYVLLRNLPHAIIKGDQDYRLAYAIKSISELSH
jgi:nicotinamide riboside kinase